MKSGSQRAAQNHTTSTILLSSLVVNACTSRRVVAFSSLSATRSLPIDPFSLQFWRLVQRLHDHTILFCLLPQCTQLLSRRLRSDNFKSGMNALTADRYFLRDTERAPKVQISFDRYFNPFDRYSHGRGNHLAGDLRAGRQSSK